MAFPELVMGLALLLLFGHGFLGPYLEALGIKVTFTKLGIVVAQFFVAFPYAVRVIYSTFEDINPRYETSLKKFRVRGIRDIQVRDPSHGQKWAFCLHQ